jgi:hypothetical protein
MAMLGDNEGKWNCWWGGGPSFAGPESSIDPTKKKGLLATPTTHLGRTVTFKSRGTLS